MYVGTYTRAPSKGIYAYRLRASGELTPMGAAGLAAETENPSFLAVHPNQRFLYAVNEVSRYEGQEAGSVSAFSIDRATGTLTLLNRVSSRGGGPCHLSDRWHRQVAVRGELRRRQRRRVSAAAGREAG